MTIQQIISAVARVFEAPEPGCKGRRRHLASARRVVVRLARAYMPHVGYAEIKKSIGMRAHSSLIAMVQKTPTLPEARAFANAEKLLRARPEVIPAPAGQPEMGEQARSIIGILNANPNAMREVVAYMRPLLSVAEHLHRAIAQQRADAANQPATVQGAKR